MTTNIELKRTEFLATPQCGFAGPRTARPMQEPGNDFLIVQHGLSGARVERPSLQPGAGRLWPGGAGGEG